MYQSISCDMAIEHIGWAFGPIFLRSMNERILRRKKHLTWLVFFRSLSSAFSRFKRESNSIIFLSIEFSISLTLHYCSQRPTFLILYFRCSCTQRTMFRRVKRNTKRTPKAIEKIEHKFLCLPFQKQHFRHHSFYPRWFPDRLPDHTQCWSKCFHTNLVAIKRQIGLDLIQAERKK